MCHPLIGDICHDVDDKGHPEQQEPKKAIKGIAPAARSVKGETRVRVTYRSLAERDGMAYTVLGREAVQIAYTSGQASRVAQS